MLLRAFTVDYNIINNIKTGWTKESFLNALAADDSRPYDMRNEFPDSSYAGLGEDGGTAEFFQNSCERRAYLLGTISLLTSRKSTQGRISGEGRRTTTRSKIDDEESIFSP